MRLREVKGQGQVLTQHREAGRSPAALAPPVVCSPGSFSPPGSVAPSCAECVGWVSESAVQIAEGS